MKAFKNSNLEKDYDLEIIGVKEKEYYNYLLRLKERLNLKMRFSEPIFDLKEKIKKIDSAAIMVLPSRFEPFGIVFLESMARGRITIATNTNGAGELLKDNEDGFIFNIGDYEKLREILNNVKGKKLTKIRNQALNSAKKFQVSKIIDKWEELFEE